MAEEKRSEQKGGGGGKKTMWTRNSRVLTTRTLTTRTSPICGNSQPPRAIGAGRTGHLILFKAVCCYICSCICISCARKAV